MPEVALLDTRRFATNLAHNGFTERQAEALVRAQVAVLSTHLATVAAIETVKADIRARRDATRAALEALRAETDAEIDRCREFTRGVQVVTGADLERRKASNETLITLLQERQEAGIEALRVATETAIRASKAGRTRPGAAQADLGAVTAATQDDFRELESATRADFEVAKALTEAAIEALRRETRARLATVKPLAPRWLIGALIADIGIAVALLRLL